MKLTIELIPKTSWYSNVRSEVSDAEWDAIRHAVYQRAGYKCEICGGTGDEHPVECHEVWSYDDEKHVQELERMIALCPSCHEVKHFGYASSRGHRTRALEHLCDVNDWSRSKGIEYVQACFDKWRKRSQHEWTVDISILEGPEYERFLEDKGII